MRRSGDHVLISRETGDIDLALVAIRGLHHSVSDGFELYGVDLATETAKVYLRHGPSIVKFLESWFGPMPGRPARVVVVNRERKSGYSRPGYIVVTESSHGSEAASAKFMAHEFAHAWWHSGDPHTENRWLSESMAEYIPSTTSSPRSARQTATNSCPQARNRGQGWTDAQCRRTH